jgi:hypothetical protein
MARVFTHKQNPYITKEFRQGRVLNTQELIAFCPKCKAFETLWFTGDGLIQTRKFNQEDTRVYHDCGSNEPCRLYRIL